MCMWCVCERVCVCMLCVCVHAHAQLHQQLQDCVANHSMSCLFQDSNSTKDRKDASQAGKKKKAASKNDIKKNKKKKDEL